MKLSKILRFLPLTLWIFKLLSATNDWPTILPIREEKVIGNIAAADTPLTVWIKNTAGRPMYKLECHTGNYENESEMNFSGDYQCALFAVKGGEPASGDLLAANTKDELSTDWWNRGRIRADQLQGDCVRYPDYSTSRHFLLRGMRITLQVKEPQWANNPKNRADHLLSGFTLGVSIVPDPHANSVRAELPSEPKPPSACYP